MAVRPVVRYPEPILKRPAEVVDTMRAGPSTVGLAAPQVGVPVRAFCLDVSGHRRASSSHGLVVLFDPELIEVHGEDVLREGCLSVPNLTANVRRAVRTVVRGVAPDGRRRVYQMEGFEARALQHELDHLDGMLILDRVESAADVFPRKVYG